MGCGGSKAVKEAAPSDTSKRLAEAPPATNENNDVDAATQDNKAQENSDAGAASGTSTRTLDESGSLRREVSVRYQAREMPSSRRSMSRRRSSSTSAAPFDEAQVGTHTRHGIMPGPRGFSAAKINQDRGVVFWPFNGSCGQVLLCIFDGHGSKGEIVSEFCMKTVPELLEAEPDELQADPPGFLTKSIIKCDELLFAGSARPASPLQPQPSAPAAAPAPAPAPAPASAPPARVSGELGKMAMKCGTTSTVAYMRGAEVYVACSGDSRAVLGSISGGQVLAADLSRDHKPDLPEEMARIVAAGGTVSPPGANNWPARVWANGRVGLAMSRSLGDGLCRRYGVIPDPEAIQRPPALPPSRPPTDDLPCNHTDTRFARPSRRARLLPHTPPSPAPRCPSRASCLPHTDHAQEPHPRSQAHLGHGAGGRPRRIHHRRIRRGLGVYQLSGEPS